MKHFICLSLAISHISAQITKPKQLRKLTGKFQLRQGTPASLSLTNKVSCVWVGPLTLSSPLWWRAMERKGCDFCVSDSGNVLLPKYVNFIPSFSLFLLPVSSVDFIICVFYTFIWSERSCVSHLGGRLPGTPLGDWHFHNHSPQAEHSAKRRTARGAVKQQEKKESRSLVTLWSLHCIRTWELL